MRLPFHWIFKRETWNRDIYTPERLAALLLKLEKHGMAGQEVTRAFEDFWGLKLRVAGERPEVLPEDVPLVRKHFREFRSHVISFVKQPKTGLDAFASHESPLARKRRVEAGRNKRDSNPRVLPKELRSIPGVAGLKLKDKHPRQAPANNAAAGYAMGQMLNQQHQTNEHLKRLRDLFGG